MRQSEFTLQKQKTDLPVSSGMPETFWAIWLHQRDDLYRLCLKWMGGNAADAEDALSQAMLKALEKLPDHAAKIHNMNAWLTRLTYHVSMEMHRKHQRDVRITQSLDKMPDPLHKLSPNAFLLTHELELYVRQAVQTLPPRLRKPFILRCYQGKSYQEITNMLMMSYESVRKRIQQARETLQNNLQAYLSTHDAHSDMIWDEMITSVLERLFSDPPSTSEREPASHCQRPVEKIDYRSTATCVKALPQTSFQFFSPLGLS